MTAAHPYPSASTISEAKVAGYLLNVDGGDGAAKAVLLMRFGFSPDRPLALMDALGQHPSPARWAAAFAAPHGIKHDFEGRPSARTAAIRTFGASGRLIMMGMVGPRSS